MISEFIDENGGSPGGAGTKTAPEEEVARCGNTKKALVASRTPNRLRRADIACAGRAANKVD
jgi:hypothetical protein